MVHTRFHESYFWWVRGRDGNISCMSYSLKANGSSTASTNQNTNNQCLTWREPWENPAPSQSLQPQNHKGYSKQVTITVLSEESDVFPRRLLSTHCWSRTVFQKQKQGCEALREHGQLSDQSSSMQRNPRPGHMATI